MDLNWKFSISKHKEGYNLYFAHWQILREGFGRGLHIIAGLSSHALIIYDKPECAFIHKALLDLSVQFLSSSLLTFCSSSDDLKCIKGLSGFIFIGFSWKIWLFLSKNVFFTLRRGLGQVRGGALEANDVLARSFHEPSEITPGGEFDPPGEVLLSSAHHW